jgi:molecular chaperone HscA
VRIKQAIKALDQATQTFAQRRMDENIRKALAGHKLEEFDVSREKSPS